MLRFAKRFGLALEPPMIFEVDLHGTTTRVSVSPTSTVAMVSR